jgi:hypothetical protein
MTNRAKNERITSPTGVASWPYLTEPDTQFDVDGKYKITLLIPVEDGGNDFVGMLEERHAHHYDQYCADKGEALKKSDLPVKVITDDDGIQQYQVKFSLKAKGERNGKKWEQRPMLFDAGMKPITGPALESLNVGSGSTCRVGFEICPYYTGMIGMGLSLRLKAVQVIDLVSYESAGAGFDFEASDGYTSSDATEASLDF